MREGGLRASLRSLFAREHRQVIAVEGASFELRRGEIVGFLGPNGAGKTTTLKMLSGLLYPDSGIGEVLGHVPHRREAAFLKRIALVTGNRSSLGWDLPALDSFLLLKALYDIPAADFERRRSQFVELLELEALVTKPVRNLSLGERMKVELAGALLHAPEVLFLDEPTLGLDVTMQKRLRQFIRAYNQETGATVLLTSHYMADVEALCERVIVIHQGRLQYDGNLSGLTSRFASHKTLTIVGEGLPAEMSGWGEVVDRQPDRVTLLVAPDQIGRVAADLLARATIDDITIEDPPIEDVIERVFAEAAGSS
ncbi:MAG TPA: ATP-binding cassette domain-containing protein [Acidimicrobiia bacterium]|nr:ATP-binding cassette domain-containing protein [Acidimicrobiia bacterium]